MPTGRLQRQRLANKKARGKEKPYEECKECLYILNDCILCKDTNEFFDRENVLQDTVSEMVVDGEALQNVRFPIKTFKNRVTTQMRDGCIV
jgi:hypothetical protein|tara:strand:+ start:2743 stop:3015 length:273 start_codon:yes stop_codon:yes gene_type:complete